MVALAAIGTVICRVEVASDPPRLVLLVLWGDSPAGSLHTEVTSSSLKLTLRTDEVEDCFLATGELAGTLLVVIGSSAAGSTLLLQAATAVASRASTAPAAAFALWSLMAVRLAEGEMLGVG